MAKMPEIKINIDAIIDYDKVIDAMKKLDAAMIATNTVFTAPAWSNNTVTNPGTIERSWCMGGPLDCQWKDWPSYPEIYIPDASHRPRKGTYRFVGYLDDDKGKYRVYHWLGWDDGITLKLNGNGTLTAYGNG